MAVTEGVNDVEAEAQLEVLVQVPSGVAAVNVTTGPSGSTEE